MQNNKAMLKAVLLMGISALALTACESMGMSNWFEDDASYAGDVKPPGQTTETSDASGQVVPPPSQQISQNLPPATTSTPQFTSSLTPSPEAPPAPPVVNQYTGNLASVPPRPAASDVPTPQQVQAARQDLNADNQQLSGTLKDPYAGLPRVPDPVAGKATSANTLQAPVTPAPAQQQVLTAPPQPQLMAPAMAPPVIQPIPQPMPQQVLMAPAPVMSPPPVAAAPAYAPPNVPAPTDQNVSGRMMGLQASGPGKYSLVQLPPDSGIGSFAMKASIVTSPPTNQINISQYKELQGVAVQYAAQRGRIRLVAYSNDPQSQEALQRITTVAAYLIDLGVPSTAVRLRIDPAPMDATQAMQAAHKTDIYLEVPINK